MPVVKPAISGAKGFDADFPLLAVQLEAFRQSGYSFCIRYIPRTLALVKGNLSPLELEAILKAGLSVMAVQHAALPGWEPSGALGKQYGQYAAQYAKMVGLLAETSLWCDLEMVASTSTPQEVIDFCTEWFNAVKAAGYTPGLYVGYGTNLTPQQLYDLPFTAYWSAYNYDDRIPVRGFQLTQHDQQVLNSVTFDPNTCQADHLGGLPLWMSPS